MAVDSRGVDPGIVRMRLALHGPGVEIECAVPSIHHQIERVLAPFAVAELPAGFSATTGHIRPYDHAEVMRHLSPSAVRIVSTHADEFVEIYQQDERFWLIDDRWGMAEINLLKGQWRSWLLPDPKLDAYRCTEMAVLWPLAQLLRFKGVHLLPAASAVCDGWAVLLICPFSLEPELRAIIRCGFRIVGQRWTALREEEGRLALLHMPGRVERPWSPRLTAPAAEPQGATGLLTDPHNDPSLPGWTDLMTEYHCAWQNHAFCDAVLVMSSGRRAQPSLREFDAPAAANLLRQAWPIPELHPSGRQIQLPLRLARQCRCGEANLTRDGRDLISILHTFREGSIRAGQLPRQLGEEEDNLAAA